MALIKIPAIYTVRRGSYASWDYSNPILLEGEMGLISSGQDEGKYKVGDGVTHWNDLPYTIGADGKAATITIVSTTTVNHDVPASVINDGDSNKVLLKFNIPRGEPGIVVPDITALAEKMVLEDDDLFYIYDDQASALKKIKVSTIGILDMQDDIQDLKDLKNYIIDMQPDYDSYDPVNKITANDGIWTSDAYGYVRVSLIGTAVLHWVQYRKNGLAIISFTTSSNFGASERIIKVVPGDKIQLSGQSAQAVWSVNPFTTTGYWCGCYFVPPKFVKIPVV